VNKCDCLQHAEDCARKAAAQTDPKIKADFFGLGAPNAAFDFASEVAEAKAASDLVQAWTTHATKQVEMLTKQASDLTTLGQQFASTSSEAVTRRVAQGSKR